MLYAFANGASFWDSTHSPHTEAVVAIVVVLRIDIAAIEVQVTAVRTAVERTWPVVAVGAAIVVRRAIEVAGSRQEQGTAKIKDDHLLYTGGARRKKQRRASG